MAVNNNFYVTINELVKRATNDTAKTIVDYESFIDFGKTLSNINGSDFANNFVAALANKIKLSIDTARQVMPQLESLVRGQVSPNAVIEIITHNFFTAQAAAFVSLTDGQSVDQYIVNKGSCNVQYYINDESYSIPVTIQGVELAGAFQSPEAMDLFLQRTIMYAMNSNTIRRTEGRRGLLAAMIKELDGKTAATGQEGCAQKYELVTLYNTIYGLTGTDDALDYTTALENSEFVKFAVRMIRKVSSKISDPSTAFNSDGSGNSITTFTPDTPEDKKLITISALDSAIVSFKNSFSPEATELGAHESVNFWQVEGKPFFVYDGGTVNYVEKDADRGTTANAYYYVKSTGKLYKYASSTYTQVTAFEDDNGTVEVASSPILAVLFDKYAAGEYLCHEAVNATPYNARGEYYDNWINVQTKYCRNYNANAVVFTLD